MAALRRQGLFGVTLMVLWACFGTHSLAAEVLSAQERQQASMAVKRTVLGILSFVRWPQQAESLTLCVTGEVQFASLLEGQLQQGNGQALSVQRHVSSDSLPLECDVLYLGALPTLAQQTLFKRFLGRPTLLISEADDECALGNMFCLGVSRQQASFRINLDSLARSPLRVHPNVLKLARERP